MVNQSATEKLLSKVPFQKVLKKNGETIRPNKSTGGSGKNKAWIRHQTNSVKVQLWQAKDVVIFQRLSQVK